MDFRKSLGEDINTIGWTVHGGWRPDTRTRQRSAECLKLLQSIEQPKDLPTSSDQIVTVRCVDGNQLVVKRFSIKKVPFEVHDILIIAGLTENNLKRYGQRLRFVQRPNW